MSVKGDSDSDSIIEVKITVIKGRQIQNFDNQLLNTG